MKFSAKENTFFLTSYKNTSHPSKDNLGNVTTTRTSMAAFKRLIKKHRCPEGEQASLDIHMLVLFQNFHQLLRKPSRNKNIHSHYSKRK